MKYCANCGRYETDDANYCRECGGELQCARCEENPAESGYAPVPRHKSPEPPKKRKLWLTIILWLCFWPIMIPVTVLRSPKMTKPAKVGLIALYMLLLVVGIASSPGTPEPEGADSNASSFINSEEEKNADLFSEIITDYDLRVDLLHACEAVGIDVKEIKEFEQADDWVSGPRYTFTYRGAPLIAYCNMDSTVEAIRIGMGENIYKRGYEPYQIEDYMVDTDIAAELQIITEDYVRSQLNYPSTADFSWLDWSYGRDHDLYSVSGRVTAQNGFGMESEVPFKLIYQLDDTQANLMYFTLNGSDVINRMDSFPQPERKRTENADQDNTATEDGSILLIEGEAGLYGKKVDLDGFEAINYHVPEGTYSVVNNGVWCKVYLAKDEYYRNSDGYIENEIVQTLEFTEHEEKQRLMVGPGEHLELTLNATITLIPEK